MSAVILILQHIEHEIPKAENVYKDHNEQASNSLFVGTTAGAVGIFLGNPLPFIFQAASYFLSAHEYKMAGYTKEYIRDLKALQFKADVLYSDLHHARKMLLFMMVVSMIVNIIWAIILPGLIIFVTFYVCIKRRN
ncbi:uncharacterized protein LOC144364543 [Saccoglossus kowalevskii]